MAVILIDLDGVIFDMEGLWSERISERFPHVPFNKPAARRSFFMDEEIDIQYHDEIFSITNEPGFFAELSVYDYAVDAIKGLDASGHTVYFCTAPLTSAPTCASDKMIAIERNFGEGWNRKVIIAKDKTFVRGDYLIDDKPLITGHFVPTWKHVVMDRPYNQNSLAPMRLKSWLKLPVFETLF